MKRLFLLGAAAAGLLLAACTKDEAAGREPQRQPTATERIYLSDEMSETDAGPASRAGFTGDGYKIAWEAGDMVSVNATKASLRNPCPLLQDEKGAWYIEAPTADLYRVVYPAIGGYEAEVDGKIIGNHVFLNDRNYQIYRENSFDPQRLVCYGETAPGGKLTLRYMVALLKVTLKGLATDKVTSLTVSSNNGESIFAGIGICGMGADGYPVLSAGDSPYTSQTLQVEQTGGVALDAQGVDFYMALFPMTLSKGFTLTVALADGRTVTRTSSQSIVLKRGKILAMPALEVVPAPVLYSTDNATWTLWNYAADGVTPATLTYPETSDHTLYFKDNADAPTPGLTRAHLQNLADTFRTRDEATAKPIRLDMGQATLAGTTEFPSDVFCGAYWNGVVDVAGGDKALTGIVFPKNMTRIADMSVTHALTGRIGALAYNSVLTDVRLPEGISYIGSGAFGFCLKLDSFTIPGAEGELTIGKYAFWAMYRTQTKLSEFRCERTTPPILIMDGTDTPFKDVAPSGMKIFVPAASLAAYQADPSWQKVMAEGTNRIWATF